MADAPFVLDERKMNAPIVVEAQARQLDGQLKLGVANGFTVVCDEPPHLGGGNSAPSPFAYLSLSLA